MITYIIGDIFKSDCNVIAHGCNCFNTMSAGFALSIRNKFIEAWKLDQRSPYGKKYKLGTIQHVECYRQNKKITIVNCYTQYLYGRDKNTVYADYTAIEKCMLSLKHQFDLSFKIGMPKIGSGLANGDWAIIENIINTIFDDRQIYIFSLN